MLQPARRKYRKEQKGRNKGLATRGAKVSFGEYGLKALERGRLTARQIEAARRAMTRHIKRGGRIWIRIFPDKPIPISRLRCGWVTERVTRNTLWLKSSQERCCTKWTVLMRCWRDRRFGSPPPNCRSR